MNVMISVTILLFVFGINSCKQQNEEGIHREKSIKQKSTNLDQYGFNDIVVRDWNTKTSEMIAIYSVCGINNEKPMMMLWGATNNGEYRKLLFDTLSKSFPKIRFEGSLLIKESFITKHTAQSNTPKVIYMFNKSAKFHASITNLSLVNNRLDFDLDTTIKKRKYEEVAKHFLDGPIILKVTSSISDHLKGQHVLDIYSGVNDNFERVFFEYIIEM